MPKPLFISNGCNRIAANISQIDKVDGILFYGAKNCISLAKPFSNPELDGQDSFTVFMTLKGPIGTQATSLNLLEEGEGGIVVGLVAGFSDGSIYVWKRDREVDGAAFHSWNGWTLLKSLKGHGSSVSVITSIYSGTSGESSIVFHLATAADDETVKTYRLTLGNGELISIGSISVGKKYATALTFLPLVQSGLVSDDFPLLMVARTDSKIYIYHCSSVKDEETDATFQYQVLTTLEGHENWIRDLQLYQTSTLEADEDIWYLASASQDTFVRVWKLTLSPSANDLEDDKENGLSDVNSLLVSLSQSKKRIKCSNRSVPSTCVIELETVLAGHSDWVYSAKWLSSPYVRDKKTLSLLTSSADRSIILWQYDASLNSWQNMGHLGEIGGNSLGFYSAHFQLGSSDELFVLAQGYTGSFHLWQKRQVSEGAVNDLFSFDTVWNPMPSLTGHLKGVTGVRWDPEGRYFMTASLDQSTRIWSTWKHQKNSSSSSSISWHEIARPQIHGYDIFCLSCLNGSEFVSGAEEKIIRLFEGPKFFQRAWATLQGLDEDEIKRLEASANIVGANVPALGLSNKGISSNMIEEKQQQESSSKASESLNTLYQGNYDDNRFQTHFHTLSMQNFEELRRAPLECDLASTSLWPETDKLYGHGFEIYALASTTMTVEKNGTRSRIDYLASACKSSTLEHAAIKIWKRAKKGNEPSPFVCVATLPGHQLTVTRLLFSPCSRFLLSVSRDRQWMLHSAIWDEENESFASWELLSALKGAHSRIIWGACWTPDSKYFLTCSRDKKIKAWSVKSFKNIATLEMNCSVNAIDCAASPKANIEYSSYSLAVGLEDGNLSLLTLEIDQGNESGKFVEVTVSDEEKGSFCHSDTVNDLAFSPDARYLASVGNDQTVRLFSI